MLPHRQPAEKVFVPVDILRVVNLLNMLSFNLLARVSEVDNFLFTGGLAGSWLVFPVFRVRHGERFVLFLPKIKKNSNVGFPR